MRTEIVIKNIKYSAIAYILTYILRFLVRFIFIKELPIEILGVNSLFGSIVTVLSFAELGIGSAIIFSLYKPLALNDKNTIILLVNFIRQAYRLIGGIIFLFGMFLIPFLDSLVGNNKVIDNITIYYLLFLFNTSISYLYIYKVSLLQADQKQYIYSIYHSIFQLILSIIQISFLYYTKSYFLFLVSIIIITIIENIYISQQVKNIYPYLDNKVEGCLSQYVKENIFNNVKALIINRFSDIVINSLSTVVMTKYIGLIVVGIYSNYTLIITSIEALFAQVINATVPSLGNLVLIQDKDKIENIFYFINFVVAWQAMLLSVIYFGVLNNFILLWIGTNFIFSKQVVICLVVQFYIHFMRRTLWTFRDAYGLYWQERYKSIIEMLTNLVLSIYFAFTFKTIEGILIASILSMLSTAFWLEPYILYKNKLKFNLTKYYFNYFKYATISILNIFCIDKILEFYFFENSYINIVYCTVLCIIVPNIIWISIFRNSKEMYYLKKLINIKLKFKSINI